MVQKIPGNGKKTLSDKKELRRRARENVEQGAVTDAYKADREKVIELLNEALATEIICVLRYKRHAYLAAGPVSESIKNEFEQHAVEEQSHADMIAARIVQLGGEPDLSPDGLTERAHSQYNDSEDIVDMMKSDLIEERVAIESYSELIRFIGDDDPTTRRMLEEILAKEEEHAEDLSSLLDTHGPSRQPRE